jgi:hypothetical protein
LKNLLLIMVTLGEPLCHDAGLKETEVAFAVSDLAPHDGITLKRLADHLGIRLSAYKETLLITVNGKVLHASLSNELMFRDGDHIGLYMMLTGG